MTNVIAFRPPQRDEAPAIDLSRTAEILFFTGVRYVRDEEERHFLSHALSAERSTIRPMPQTPVTDERRQA